MYGNFMRGRSAVTPLAGVWIEILRRRRQRAATNVTPLAGVWIEIVSGISFDSGKICHSPRGSVD